MGELEKLRETIAQIARLLRQNKNGRIEDKVVLAEIDREVQSALHWGHR